MRELMHANVSTFVAILIEFKKIFLAAGSKQTAKPSRPLIDRQSVILVELFSLQLSMLGQIGSHLISADDVQLGAGDGEIGEHRRLIAQEHAEPTVLSNLA